MSTTARTILIHPEAQAKPALGAPCNGCGVCCLSEPCPLGVVLSGRRSGACRALRWSGSSQAYQCGAISQPDGVLSDALPRLCRPTIQWLAPMLSRLAPRWIAAGAGCDCALEVLPGDDPATRAEPSPIIQVSEQTPHHPSASPSGTRP